MTHDEREREDEKEIRALAEQLERLPEVREHDVHEEKQSEIMAYGLADIAEEATEVGQLFERLRGPGLTDEQRLEALKDMGEALRHLDYHIHDMAFFDAYVDDVEQ